MRPRRRHPASQRLGVRSARLLALFGLCATTLCVSANAEPPPRAAASRVAALYTATVDPGAEPVRVFVAGAPRGLREDTREVNEAFLIGSRVLARRAKASLARETRELSESKRPAGLALMARIEATLGEHEASRKLIDEALQMRGDDRGIELFVIQAAIELSIGPRADERDLGRVVELIDRYHVARRALRYEALLLKALALLELGESAAMTREVTAAVRLGPREPPVQTLLKAAERLAAAPRADGADAARLRFAESFLLTELMIDEYRVLWRGPLEYPSPGAKGRPDGVGPRPFQRQP